MGNCLESRECQRGATGRKTYSAFDAMYRSFLCTGIMLIYGTQNIKKWSRPLRPPDIEQHRPSDKKAARLNKALHGVALNPCARSVFTESYGAVRCCADLCF